jgi:hypothetical protein
LLHLVVHMRKKTSSCRECLTCSTRKKSNGASLVNASRVAGNIWHEKLDIFQSNIILNCLCDESVFCRQPLDEAGSVWRDNIGCPKTPDPPGLFHFTVECFRDWCLYFG